MRSVRIIDGSMRRRGQVENAVAHAGLQVCPDFLPHRLIDVVLVHSANLARAEFADCRSDTRPGTALVAYGEAPSPESVVDALRSGIDDFWSWPFGAEALADRLPVAAQWAQAGCDRSDTDAARERIAQLSRREREVLEQMIAGDKTKAIGRALGISHRTVEIHCANMRAKLGTSTTGAIALRLAAGLSAARD